VPVMSALLIVTVYVDKSDEPSNEHPAPSQLPLAPSPVDVTVDELAEKT
jgi:hypothetical protein